MWLFIWQPGRDVCRDPDKYEIYAPKRNNLIEWRQSWGWKNRFFLNILFIIICCLLDIVLPSLYVREIICIFCEYIVYYESVSEGEETIFGIETSLLIRQYQHT